MQQGFGPSVALAERPAVSEEEGKARGRRPRTRASRLLFVDPLGVPVPTSIEPHTMFKQRLQASQHQGESLRRIGSRTLRVDRRCL